MGHYAIAEYAALAEAGIIPVDELETYGSDDSRLPMSGMSTYTPGMEISGGSLGHGLGLAVGMALGLRFQGNPARVINMMSDGELDEGSTWEAAMAAAHHGLGNLLCVVDMNALQADGPTAGVLRTEPVVDKWAAFGWRTVRVDGNDIAALVDGFRLASRPTTTDPPSSSATPRSAAACRSWKPGKRRTSSASTNTNGTSPARRCAPPTPPGATDMTTTNPTPALPPRPPRWLPTPRSNRPSRSAPKPPR